MTPLELIRDACARLARIHEAIGDGEYYLAMDIVADLESDLAGWMAEPLHSVHDEEKAA